MQGPDRPAGAELIDVRHRGTARVIGAWRVGGAIVDPGPERSLDTLLEQLDEPPSALLLTHIHLDHSGGAGALVRRFPELRIHVHESGARHLADPSKLLASASRLYSDMEELWGEVIPVPEANLRPLSGGETAEGLRVEYTPGHASHHVAYLDESTGDAFVGDIAGVRISPGFVIPPTPPPDIDLDAWRQSLELVASWRPRRLCIAHFGAVDEPEPHIEATLEALSRLADRARNLDCDAFLAELENDIEAHSDAGDADLYRLAVPPIHVWLGLERYWAKRGVLDA